MLSLLAFLLLGLVPQEAYVHESPGFEVVLPSAAWKPRDLGSDGVFTILFSPVADMTTRCTVMRIPPSFLADGLRTREEQIRQSTGDAYQRVGLTDETLDNREVTRWDYTLAGGPTVEWGFQDELGWVILQIAAPPEAWNDPAQREELDAIAASFHWTGGAAIIAAVDRTPVETIRETRAQNLSAATRSFAITRHTIEAIIEPEHHTLEVDDALEIESRQDGLQQLRLYTTQVTVDDVTADVALEWKVESTPQVDILVLDLELPLDSGERLALDVHTGSDDFLQTTDQQLVQEISVVGQIRPRSSFSSHVVWYPIDQGNDAVVDITFDVPAPYTALTGGTLIEESEEGERRLFRYREEHQIPRILPFGFAVGKYSTVSGTSEAGLELSSWGFEGEDKRIEQRREVLLECAAAFERALGPLPWSTVRFVHVTPIEKETGISLPGMIVVSDAYFPDLEGVDGSSGNLSDPGVLGLLVVADELSHQWNFYASGFPNELAEGISTYTNALFLEVRHGTDAYHGTIRYCASAWIQSAGEETEFAVANPRVYTNTRYRPVVFCKTPLVLDVLRRRLGDEVFFAGMRRGFDLRDHTIDGFDRLRLGFEEASGQDLRWFFDQWFYRAGFPTLEISTRTDASQAFLEVTQTQEEDPYRLTATAEVTCEDGSSHVFPVEIERRSHSYEWELPSPVREVRLGPEGRLPARLVLEH